MLKRYLCVEMGRDIKVMNSERSVNYNSIQKLKSPRNAEL